MEPNKPDTTKRNQVSFSTSDADVTRFADYCSQRNLKQKDAFTQLMDTAETLQLIRGDKSLEGNLSEFRHSLNNLLEIVMELERRTAKADIRARAEVEDTIVSKDSTIQALQDDYNRLSADITSLKQTAEEATAARDKAIAESVELAKRLKSAEESVADKASIIDNQNARLVVADKKSNGYDALALDYDELTKKHESVLNEITRQAAAFEALKTSHQVEVDKLNVENQRLADEAKHNLKELQLKSDSDISTCKHDHTIELEKLKSKYESKIQELQSQLTAAQASIDHAKEIAAYNAKLAQTQIAALEADVKRLSGKK